MFNAGMFGCGGATSSTSPFGLGKGGMMATVPTAPAAPAAPVVPSSNLPKALQIAASRAQAAAPLFAAQAAAPAVAAAVSGAPTGTPMGTRVPDLSEVDMDSMASMMSMATMALAAGGSSGSLPKIPLPVGKPVTPAAAAQPTGLVPPGRVEKQPPPAVAKPKEEVELPTSTGVKVSDDEGKLSLDELVKKVGEKVNKAGGLTAIGYGAAKGKPYVRGRPKPNSVIADDYREGPYSRGKGKGDSGSVEVSTGVTEGRYSGGMGSMGQLY